MRLTHSVKYFVNTVYRRKLPDVYIRGASQQGKRIFRQSLQQGNMQCYFPLIQQFTTQIQPQTCGPTSLVMVLNSLGVDPNKPWKGIWRWYTQQNLNLMTKQILKSGLKLSSWTHIARHNHLDVSTFYYPNFNNLQLRKGLEVKHQCKQQCKDEIKTASYQSFKDCVLSSARRQGFILTLNHSRKKLLQTGSGHYSPIGGYNKKRNLVLMLDVARYKYPTYWCDLRSLYQSLEQTDNQSKLPRGFVLVSKKIQNRSQICNVGLDYLSIKLFHQKLLHIKNVLTDKQDKLKILSKKICSIFNHEIRSLLVYFLFEFTNARKHQIENIFSKIRNQETFNVIKQEIINNSQLDKLQDYKNLKGLINDFLPTGKLIQIIFIIMISLPDSIIKIDYKQNYNTQIKYFRSTFGIFSQFPTKNQNFL